MRFQKSSFILNPWGAQEVSQLHQGFSAQRQVIWAIRTPLQPAICYRTPTGARCHNLPDITSWSGFRQLRTNVCKGLVVNNRSFWRYKYPTLERERGAWKGHQRHLLHMVLKELNHVHMISFKSIYKATYQQVTGKTTQSETLEVQSE